MDIATVNNSGHFGCKVRALVHCTSLGAEAGLETWPTVCLPPQGLAQDKASAPAWASGPASVSSSSLQGAPSQAQSARMALSAFSSRSQGAQKTESGDKAAGQTLKGWRVFTPLLWRGPLFFKAPPSALRRAETLAAVGFEKVCEMSLIIPGSQVLVERCPEDSGMLKTPSRTLCLVWRKDPDMAARAELSSLRGSLSSLFSISEQNGKVLRKMLLRDLGLKPCTDLREYSQGIPYQPGSSWLGPIGPGKFSWVSPLWYGIPTTQVICYNQTHTRTSLASKIHSLYKGLFLLLFVLYTLINVLITRMIYKLLYCLKDITCLLPVHLLYQSQWQPLLFLSLPSLSQTAMLLSSIL